MGMIETHQNFYTVIGLVVVYAGSAICVAGLFFTGALWVAGRFMSACATLRIIRYARENGLDLRTGKPTKPRRLAH